ncbi:uncharacterized protein N7496_004215 [Penicillium cataractarum]|uniref:Zn(2)-C6 fungal-type domain-containing protein n=1 Tax=Penicillium cataractarum TaxID=2100454 RepID=A0A9W9SNL2_9EURO|nr:uncharacterized protein N7496_004215 [Penicillium cataractarum]KAJ5381787.1 hypothetical protein N7496_004215 [Penicillium cataractarum]
MSSHNSTTMTGSEGRSGPPSQKLKDSCDMCSSSKVKCNKEKPVCSRCRKLGYPCFYSPARRIGRPHPNRRTISRKSPEARPTLSRKQSAIYTSAPNTPEDSQLLCQDSRVSLDIQPSIFDENECSSAVTYGPNPIHWLDDMYMPAGGLGETETITASAMNWGSYVFNDGFDQKQTLNVPQSPPPDFDLFNFSDALNRDPQWLNSLQPQVDSSFIPLEISLPQSISQGSSAVAPEAVENHTRDQTPISDSSEPDCVIGAIDILRRLQTSKKPSIETLNGTSEQEVPGRVQTAAWAIHRLSTILVCPCSRKTYVGILVATVCMVIMDVYDSLFHRSHHRKAGDHTMGHAQIMDPNYSLDLHADQNECIITEFGAPTDFESDDGEAHMSSVHILEELSKLANVVMQFARRYRGDACVQPTGTISVLADSLKLRLRSITNEAFQKCQR